MSRSKPLLWKKKAATFREADDVHVYDRNGRLVVVDDLAEAVQAGDAMVASVSLNL